MTWGSLLSGKDRPLPPPRDRHLLTPEEMRNAFAVPTTQMQWRATMQVINEESDMALRAAMDMTLNPAGCACEVASIEHLDRLRQKLEELRAHGLKVPIA